MIFLTRLLSFQLTLDSLVFFFLNVPSGFSSAPMIYSSISKSSHIITSSCSMSSGISYKVAKSMPDLPITWLTRDVTLSLSETILSCCCYAGFISSTASGIERPSSTSSKLLSVLIVLMSDALSMFINGPSVPPIIILFSLLVLDDMSDSEITDDGLESTDEVVGSS